MANHNSEKIIRLMLEDLQKHKRNKQDLLEYYITERINKQVNVYYEQILTNCNILKHQDNELLVAKRLTK